MLDAHLKEVPIFPLGTVLFPDGALPLKIFEQRYLEMTKVCLRDELPFGVCLIREGYEVGAPALPERTGCLATIAQWDMPQLGMFHLLARGGARFRIVDTHTAPNGLITGQIELLPADAGVETVDKTCSEVLKLIIDKAGAGNFPSPVKLDDPAWVAYRLAEILPIEMAVRQRILEMDDAGERLTLLRGVLVSQGLTR
ncbi:MAG: LON peptidase substrate-binding domain-containing protein [Burkholderiales bacterium]|nr:LON peptidase substrate-binding domain-containing protein [Burkholderiales bacterium]